MKGILVNPQFLSFLGYHNTTAPLTPERRPAASFQLSAISFQLSAISFQQKKQRTSGCG